MSERIRGKVARISSDREVVINKGRIDGVTLNDYFYIKDEPIEIVDPDTGENLGAVAPIKVVVQVREVNEKFCIARTFRERDILVEEAVEGNDAFANVLNPLGSYLQPSRPAKYETRVETFRLDPSQGKSIHPEESIVKVGDSVESLLDGESTDPVTATVFR